MRHPLYSGLAVIGVVLGVGGAILKPKPWLVWNVTASAPLGLYRSASGPVARGDWVLVTAPHDARELAAVRHYLPRNVPMVKQIAALGGDTVCRFKETVSVNAVVRAVALERDRFGRPLPRWRGCTLLRPGQVFLLTAPPASFDGRYFGPVPANNLIERIEPLWTF